MNSGTTYYSRKERGVCVKCGENPPVTGRVLCSACAEKRNQEKREDHAWYKEHGICTYCHHEKAIDGRTKCAACLYVIRLYKKNPRTEETKLRDKQRSQQRRDNLRAEGLCQVCGKRPAETNTICDYCRASKRNKAEERNRAAGKMPRYLMGDGYHCYICGSEDLQPGKKLCKKHYAEKAALIKKVHQEWVESKNIQTSVDSDSV